MGSIHRFVLLWDFQKARILRLDLSSCYPCINFPKRNWRTRYPQFRWFFGPRCIFLTFHNREGYYDIWLEWQPVHYRRALEGQECLIVEPTLPHVVQKTKRVRYEKLFPVISCGNWSKILAWEAISLDKMKFHKINYLVSGQSEMCQEKTQKKLVLAPREQKHRPVVWLGAPWRSANRCIFFATAIPTKVISCSISELIRVGYQRCLPTPGQIAEAIIPSDSSNFSLNSLEGLTGWLGE